MDIAPFAAMLLLNKKLVDFAKELLPNTIENKAVQVAAFAIGVLLAWLFAESNFGDGIQAWDGVSLASLNAAGLVAYGMAVGAGAGVVNDAIERRNPDGE